MQKIKNYSNYSVDENGNIYSNFRLYVDKNKNQVIKQRTIRLKPSLMKNGYQRVSLYDDLGNKKTRLIHRIVAETLSKIPLMEQLKIISELMLKSNKELSEQYNIDTSVFSRIRNKKAWKYTHKIYNLNAQRLSKG